MNYERRRNGREEYLLYPGEGIFYMAHNHVGFVLTLNIYNCNIVFDELGCIGSCFLQGSFEGFLSAPGLCNRIIYSVFIAAHNRLDVQHRSYRTGNESYSPAFYQIFKSPDTEKYLCIAYGVFHCLFYLIKAESLFNELPYPDCRESCTYVYVKSVYKSYVKSVRITIAYYSHCIESSAQTA